MGHQFVFGIPAIQAINIAHDNQLFSKYGLPISMIGKADKELVVLHEAEIIS